MSPAQKAHARTALHEAVNDLRGAGEYGPSDDDVINLENLAAVFQRHTEVLAGYLHAALDAIDNPRPPGEVIAYGAPGPVPSAAVEPSQEYDPPEDTHEIGTGYERPTDVYHGGDE